MVDVLTLCPHTDDELNFAGTLYRHIEDGDNLRLLSFSTGNSKTGAQVSEFIDSMAVLNVKNYELLPFTTRYFPRDRQRVLQVLLMGKRGYTIHKIMNI